MKPLAGRCVVIDDDDVTRRVLEERLRSWGMEVATLDRPTFPLQSWGGLPASMILLDIHLKDTNGLDWIPDILERYPSIKIIVMTGYPDKEFVLRALRLGAFDFLEKPITSELLRHSVSRALEVCEKEENLNWHVQNLKESQQKLQEKTERLESLNERLIETNRAFSTFARNIDLEREQMLTEIAQKVSAVVVPTIQKLQQAKDLERYAMELDLLRNTLEGLCSGFSADTNIAITLSTSELRVASLIKSGLTTEQIADSLHISPDTVKTHRKNIRKKLKINGNSYNLKKYLQSKTKSA